MKVSAVISRPDIRIDSTNKSAIVSGAVISAGIILGAALYVFAKDSLTGDLFDYFISFSVDFSNKNKPEIISGLIMQNIIYFVLMLIFGTSVIGSPAVYFLSLLKTSGLGLLIAYIYDCYALKGIEYCLLVMFPGKFLLIFAMVLLTQNCSHMSTGIYQCIKNTESRGADIRKFSARSVLILIILLISSLVDFVALISFSSLFDFS
ncbi:MAG: stage II sporulation protein M [Clostridia bacterium]|nr:stage II sporulation protein M [Clostridia bacterium]